MIIRSKFKDYTVHIHNDLKFLKQLSETPNAEFVIDEKVYNLYRHEFTEIEENRLYLMEATEERKVIDTALAICEKMTDIPAKRNARLISIGGGIIQDITGFVANILYRGIPWTYIPTTLLSSCDSCIGGKSSLNYKKFKNLLGTFYPPDELHISPVFFHTLSQRDFESGLGEVIKFNIMAGEAGLTNIEKHIDALLNREEDCLNRFVESSLAFKKGFIEADEFDRGERIKLNFAHTFGHTIETLTEYQIPHGTAVAIGMIMANRISELRGLLTSDIARRSENVLLRVIHIDVRLDSVPFEKFIETMRKDKKQTSSALTAVLMTAAARDLRIVHDIQEDEVRDALSWFQQIYDKTGVVTGEM